MTQAIRYLNICFSFFLMIQCISCTDPKQDLENPDGYHLIQATLSPYNNGENAAVLEGENDIKDLQACLFENGLLTKVYTNLDISSETYTLQLEKASGTLYMIANAAEYIDVQQLSQQGVTEDEWLATPIATNKGKAINFFTSKLSLEKQMEEQTVLPMKLERGTARIDLLLDTNHSTAIKSITLKDVVQETFIFTHNETDQPKDFSKGDLNIVFAHPLSHDSLGIAYVYEQGVSPLKVQAEIIMDDKTYIEETNLPNSLKRNTIYKLTVHKGSDSTEPELIIKEWGNEESTLYPDFDSNITVNQVQSKLPDDIQISESGDTLSLPCRAMDFTVVLNCDDELEFSSSTHPDITVKLSGSSDSHENINEFTIHKPLLPPGYPEETAKIYFKRKGLKDTYDEDCITFTLQENPIQLEGLAFDRTNYTCNFERYLDNEIGRFGMPEDMEVIVTFENEDPWIKIEKAPDATNTYRILGGWKPNDPKADGRQQAARLIVRRISDKQEMEVYTVIRRNFGLPVTYLNGTWWCRYNAIGNSKDFKEQILSANDPARLSGQTVQEYLKTCTSDEYLYLWNAAYEGNNGIALKAECVNEKITLNGWRNSESNHINRESPTALAPEGYEMPTFEDYKQIFSSFVIPTSWSGFNPQLGGEDYRCEIILEKRSGIQLDGHTLNELWSFSVRSIKDKGEEPLTFYGVGCQWNNNGINNNWLLMACYNPNVTGWLVRGSNASLEHNAADANNTRIIRFKKSPVEYIYK